MEKFERHYVWLPKSLYEQAKALGFNMRNYKIVQRIPVKD